MKNHEDSCNATKNDTRLNRRNFIAYSAGLGTGLLALASCGKQATGLLESPASQEPVTPPPPLPDSSRVVLARSDNLFGSDEQPDKKQIEEMLNRSMTNLLGIDDPAEAWRSLFSPDDVVGIKVNCIAGPNLASHPAVVAAIVAELQKVPIPAEHIIIWDRKDKELTRAGYTINLDKPGVRCYGTKAVGYEKKASKKGSFNGRLSKILTRQITALINVPILKNHGGAGVTIAMKNHYGSFHNPRSHHGNHCDPSIADLNSLDEIRGKTRLIVCDATRATCNGGPGYKPAFVWNYSGLMLSRDPVALDTVGTQIINERRVEVGLPTLAEAGKHPRQLASATERGLGNTEESRIDLQRLAV